MRTKKGIKELITGIIIGEGIKATDLEKNAVDRIIEALTDENNLVIPDVVKSLPEWQIYQKAQELDEKEFEQWMLSRQ